jgi:DNA-binding GntR family transcriptional regulator
MTVNVQSIPLFVQVAETLKTRIRNHEYSPGEAIPSAKALEKEFDVSNITIRRAVEQLAREGYVVPKRGVRPRVAELEKTWVEIEITGNFRTWIDTAVGEKLGIRAKLLDRQILDCPKPLRDILALDPKEKVERIKRVRELRGEPISYYVTFASSLLTSRLSDREIEKGPFVDSLQNVCKRKLKSMEQNVHASIADMDLAGILHVDFGFPLFFVQNIYYSEKNKPMAITQMYYRSDRYVYSAKRKL